MLSVPLLQTRTTYTGFPPAVTVGGATSNVIERPAAEGGQAGEEEAALLREVEEAREESD